MKIRLPYPPSVNDYYGRNRFGSVYIKKQGKEYRKGVIEQLDGVETLEGRLSVKIVLTMPDRRRRDIDNISKCLLDSLQRRKKEGFSGIYKDDCQIDDLRIVRGDVEKPGWADIEIKVI